MPLIVLPSVTCFGAGLLLVRNVEHAASNQLTNAVVSELLEVRAENVEYLQVIKILFKSVIDVSTPLCEESPLHWVFNWTEHLGTRKQLKGSLVLNPIGRQTWPHL